MFEYYCTPPSLPVQYVHHCSYVNRASGVGTGSGSPETLPADESSDFVIPRLHCKWLMGVRWVGQGGSHVESVSPAVPLNPGTIPSLPFLEQCMQWFGKFDEQFLDGGLGHTPLFLTSTLRVCPAGGEVSMSSSPETRLTPPPWGCGGSMWGHGCAREESNRFIEQSRVELLRQRIVDTYSSTVV